MDRHILNLHCPIVRWSHCPMILPMIQTQPLPMPGLRSIAISILYCLMTACADHQHGRIMTSEGIRRASWTDEELSKQIAVRGLGKTSEASFHLVRVVGAEKPHIHEQSDLTTFVLSGRVRMHLADRVAIMGKGDVIEIPRNVVHWVENLHPEGSVAYVIFTPPFDRKDVKPVE